MRPLIQGPVMPPQQVFEATPEYMIHHFQPVRPLQSGGALNYAYTTFGAQPQSLVGTGSGLSRQGLRPITVPMVSLPTIVMQGNGYEPGTFTITPVTQTADGEVPQQIF